MRPTGRKSGSLPCSAYSGGRFLGKRHRNQPYLSLSTLEEKRNLDREVKMSYVRRSEVRNDDGIGPQTASQRQNFIILFENVHTKLTHLNTKNRGRPDSIHPRWNTLDIECMGVLSIGVKRLWVGNRVSVGITRSSIRSLLPP